MSAPVDVLVVGAGPTGLALALQAHAHGAEVRIVDRRSAAARPSRALIVQPRTLEGLRPLGVTQSLLERADIAPRADVHLGNRVLRVSLANLALPETAFPHLTLARQQDVESVLLNALADRGVDVEWGVEVIATHTAVAGARALVQSSAGTQTIACDFVAGCDGPESTVRRSADIGWRGGRYQQEVVLADVELDADALAHGLAHVVVGARGVVLVFAIGEHATWRVLASRPAGLDPLRFGRPGPPVARDELQAMLDDAGLDARITSLAWSARYALQHRLADRFQHDRLFLVGDAAHAYSPATGQGMNTGIQDALNLGWKLAFARGARDPGTLLGSYARERRPVARRVLALTHLAFWAEAGTDPCSAFLRGVLAPLGSPAIPAILSHPRLVAEVIRAVFLFRLGYCDSPLSTEDRPRRCSGPRIGQWQPDATVHTRGRQSRLRTLLAQPGVHLLLDRDAPSLERLTLAEHVHVHRLESTPGTGVVGVRPDGYVGFASGTVNVCQLRAWLARIGR